MKCFQIILLIIITFTSCKSAKNKSVVTKKVRTEVAKKTPSSALVNNIINHAKAFEGVRYKYGGTTKKGMDCSGLIYTAFKSEQISIPRTTKDLSVSGDWVDLKNVKKGDLLFFATKKNNRKVNHVGIVTSARVGRIEFMHATTSKGVISSLLSDRYWYFAFVQARRIM